MKDINYSGGCLSDQIKKYNEKPTLTNDQKIAKNLRMALLVFSSLTTILSIVTHNIAGLSTAISTLSIYISSKSSDRSLALTSSIQKRNILTKLFELEMELIKHDKELTADDLANAVVIEKNHALIDVIDEGISDYVEEITSDIYCVDIKGKITILREIKRGFVLNELDSVEVRNFSLSQLELYEEEDITESLPVKQVLELKKDA